MTREERAAGDRERAAVEQAGAGSPEALGELLEQHRPRLERMVRFRLDERLRGRVDAADVVQECFANVLGNPVTFLEKADMSFFVWLRLETAKHLNALHRRHLAAQARDVRVEVPLMVHGVPGASSFALASAILDRTNTPSRAAMRDEQARRVLEAVERMKGIDREVLMLRSFEQLTNKEVAQVLELSESAATLRYVRAIERLQVLLAGLDVDSRGFG